MRPNDACYPQRWLIIGLQFKMCTISLYTLWFLRLIFPSSCVFEFVILHIVTLHVTTRLLFRSKFTLKWKFVICHTVTHKCRKCDSFHSISYGFWNDGKFMLSKTCDLEGHVTLNCNMHTVNLFRFISSSLWDYS